ncbi:phosphoribosylaminoimidazolesuccinocarboxamide synthase [Nonomuraea sp. NPDC050310]|uniref:phosphoribosylaminoimidazolesuccinocarboxamide synthase n=1 Tax=Nonomuraea sp. NPDC050310 TaxID=3154935 RepID=UPI003404C109
MRSTRTEAASQAGGSVHRGVLCARWPQSPMLPSPAWARRCCRCRSGSATGPARQFGAPPSRREDADRRRSWSHRSPRHRTAAALPDGGVRHDARLVNRFLGPAEAQRLTGLDDRQFQGTREITLTVNEILTRHAREVSLSHCDGKLEYLLTGAARLVLADSPGTPDESRLMFDGVHCGKQILRDWYVTHGHEVPVNALIADGVPRDRWPRPKPLPPEFLPVMSQLYQALTERWTGQRWSNAPDLPSAICAARRLICS